VIEKDSPSIMSFAASRLTKVLGAAFIAAALAAIAAGCSLSAIVAAPDETGPLNQVDSGSDDGGGGSFDAAHDAHLNPGYEGSPLCNASHSKGGCYPDDPATPQLCNLAPDGGAYDSQASYNKDGSVLACHVQPANGAPKCTPAGYGTDGQHCATSTDCAAGYECVGAGVCQHYCCEGACLGGPNVNGKDLFCDIQPMAQSTSTKVPVCSMVYPCKLLVKPSGCADTETCSVVRGDGTTSCVAVGAAKAGDDCESDHCAADLVCLGAPGLRKCYALCHVSAPVECSQSQKCTTGLPLFQDPSIGYCN
jgi:hypothetical protein